MQDVQDVQGVQYFGPNWRSYAIVLSVCSLLSMSTFWLFGYSLLGLWLCSLILLFTSGYFLFNQNKLELSATKIIQTFINPLHLTDSIEVNMIDWLALDTREYNWSRYQLFCRASVIIKLKSGQIITINLARLNKKDASKDYFIKLGDQMANHDSELFKLKDLHGFNQLVTDATLGLTDLIEAMHLNLTRTQLDQTPQQTQPKKSTARSIYKNIKTITGLTGGGIDGLLAQVSPLLTKKTSADNQGQTNKNTKVSFERAALLSALNGMLGDYMENTNNPMSIPMRLRRNGHSLILNTESLTESIQPITGKLLLMVHGLCMNDLQWKRKGHDHGASLSLDLGYTPVYLRYNTGQHISTNGQAFSELIDVLVKIWPVPIQELVIIGHSMGGLVTRSAFYYGEKFEHQWVRKIQKMIFLGSPHHGAPLERGGNWIDTVLGSTPYTAPLARLGKVRSSGITDLRYGNVIDEHWQDRDRFEPGHDIRTPVPLPKEVLCFTIAGTTGNKVGDVRDQLLGDGLVQVNSALGQHKDSTLSLDIPEERQWLSLGVNHMDLLNDAGVYTKIKQRLS